MTLYTRKQARMILDQLHVPEKLPTKGKAVIVAFPIFKSPNLLTITKDRQWFAFRWETKQPGEV